MVRVKVSRLCWPLSATRPELGRTFWSLMCLVSSLWSCCVSPCDAIKLQAVLSQHGVRGSVTFSNSDSPTTIHILVNLTVDINYAGEYSWGIYEYPIDYSKPEYCHSRHLGRKPIINFDPSLSKLLLMQEEEPDETSTAQSEEVAAEAEEEDKNKQDEPFFNRLFEFRVEDLVQLTGEQSIWGRSLVIEGPSRERICATIQPDVEDGIMRTAEARFISPVGGSVWFTMLSKGDSVETKILTDLNHVQESISSKHSWQIFITDILDSDYDTTRGSCDFLQILYDPENLNDEGCSPENRAKCRQGDLSGKFGPVVVGKQESMFTKNYHTDVNLELPELEGPRSVYLVLYDDKHADRFYACAKIRLMAKKLAKARFSQEGITGEVSFQQLSPFFPVEVSVQFSGLSEGAGSFHIHEFPVPMKAGKDDTPCGKTGAHFNPFNVDASASPKPGMGSFDKYELGDLSGKYGGLQGKKDLYKSVVDPNLSIFGPLSIIGRSVVVHKTPVPNRWVCANIQLDNVEITTMVATFTYPIAGRIIFKQEQDQPLADTSVFVESLLYSDGTKTSSSDHEWHVHMHIPGKDYFNWTGRCLSAGEHFNPFRISLDRDVYGPCVNDRTHYRCEVGDLTNKLGRLSVAGKKDDLQSTVKFFTDTNLPLSGAHSIGGRSVVLHDDHAPEHRGNRMACTGIYRRYRHKAVAKDWFGNGEPPPIEGRVEFVQYEGDVAHVLVDLNALKGKASAYHIHSVPIQPHLEFPCTGDAIGGHFAPFDFDPSQSPKAGQGTHDQYEVGDLSGKFGLLDNKQSFRGVYNDSNLFLFGSNSLLGRSIVIHTNDRGSRWACASIGWGFDPDEAKEIRAIASFHHPKGFAWGFIRFKQVVYKDGSKSDTTMEVRLKYPGKTNNKATHGHDWSVFVNPVGHDAAVEFHNARCTAAGYRWNPTHIQLADPNDKGFYREECGPDNPFRCEVGDLSSRNGKISIGGKTLVVNDVNLPLQGEDWFTSAIGKSIVIQGPDGSSERMACGNIEADNDIVKFATIHTKARFNLATFMEEVQAIMGVPEWYLYTDSRYTKSLHGGRCLQIQLHFTGPHASKLEQDFGTLLKTGKLESPSIAIPGYVPDPERRTKLSYRECNSDTVNKSPSFSSSSSKDIYSPYSSRGEGTTLSHGLFYLCLSVVAFRLIA